MNSSSNKILGTFFLILVLTACFAPAASAQDKDFCDFCGREIQKSVFIATDKVTGNKYLICSDCLKLPRCSICDLPVIEKDLKLADGRRYCARDAQNLVLDIREARRICSQVEDDLDRLFSRFTSFSLCVGFSFMDQLEANSMAGTFGKSTNTFERSDLLGFIRADKPYGKDFEQSAISASLRTGRPLTDFGLIRYNISLLTGRPLVEFKATCAHELAHAWVAENVPAKRKRISSDSFFPEFEQKRILGKDAEEGFCELVAYMLMDSKHEEAQKQIILENLYTRGQTALFIEAEKRYGFNDIMDWMKYGETAQLEVGHVDEIRNVEMPVKNPAADIKPVAANFITVDTKLPASAPATIKLQGITWGKRPMAMINGRSFFSNDQFSVKIGTTNASIRCLEIQTNSVRIQHVDSGEEEELPFYKGVGSKH
jgi:hypothetical protein